MKPASMTSVVRRDVAAGFGHQVQDRVADVLGSIHGTGRMCVPVKVSMTSVTRRLVEVGTEQSVDEVVVDHVGVHAGRIDRVDPNAVLPQLSCQRGHQAGDAVLGRGVGRDVLRTLERLRRTDEDDLPPSFWAIIVGTAAFTV